MHCATRSAGSPRPASSPSSRSPRPAASPRGIAAGPDGNLWFTELHGEQDRADHHGRRHHRVPDPHGQRAIRAGSRPARTATSGSPSSCGNKIGRITTAGVVTEFPDPHGRQQPLGHRGRPGRQPLVHRVAVGNQIGRITTAGVITEFPVPTAGSDPRGIAAGPDGNLWFTEYRRQPDRPDHDGRRRHRVPDPRRRAASPSASRPARTATSGSPKRGHCDSQIGRITTAGVDHRVPDPHPGSGPVGIAAGPDGNLWFTEAGRQPDRPDHDGRRRHASSPIPTASSGPLRNRGRPGRQPLVHRAERQPDRPDHDGRRRHRVPDAHGQRQLPSGIAAGPDGNLWFTETDWQPDRPDHDGRRHHRVPDPHGQQSALPASRPARTATSGSPKQIAQPDRPDHDGRRHHRVPDPHGRQRPSRHRGRPGRQPLVHRGQLATRSAGSPRPASSPSSRSPRPAALLRGIAAGPDGNLWFTERDRQQDRPDHDSLRRRRSSWPSTPIPSTGGNSNANGVLEPGETVQVDPSWKNTLTDPAELHRNGFEPRRSRGATYTIDDSSADYGTSSRRCDRRLRRSDR